MSRKRVMFFPDVVVNKIYERLPGRDVCRASCVCRQWAWVALTDRQLWDTLFKRDFGASSRDDTARTRFEYSQEWGWRFGPVHTSTMYGHRAVVWNVSLCQGLIISASVNGTVRILDGVTKQCVGRVDMPSKVFGTCLHDGKVYMGMVSGGVRVWDLSTDAVEDIGMWQRGGVASLEANEKLIACGGLKGDLLVCDRRARAAKSEWSWRACDGCVSCVQFAGNGKLLSGGADCKIMLWDVYSMRREVTFSGHVGCITCLQCISPKIVSGSLDKTLRVWNLRTGACLMTLTGHAGFVTCLRFDETKVVSGSTDGSVKLWDTANGKCFRSLEGHRDTVNCIALDKNKVVTGSRDTTLRVWEFAPKYGVRGYFS